MNTNVNPEMLTLARDIRGLTQSKLAEISNIRHTKISRYEGGVTPIDSVDLQRLAQALDFPIEFFMQEGSRFGAETAEVFHRRRQSVKSSDLKRIDGLVNLYRIGTRMLFLDYDLDYTAHVPSLTVGDFSRIEELAATVREMWNMPSGPVSNLISWLERASCLVFNVDFKTDKIDEVVQWIPPASPIILANSASPADRLRFSLAHALGHLVMHRRVLPYDEMEDEANQFAAAFLMPEEDIIDELAPVSIHRMLELKQNWKVSMQALIYRAKDLGVIEESRYRSMFQQLSRLGYRKTEPFPIAHESPRVVESLLDSHKEDLGYSDVELAKLLKVRLEDYYEWYYPKKIIEFPSNDFQFGFRGSSDVSLEM